MFWFLTKRTEEDKVEKFTVFTGMNWKLMSEFVLKTWLQSVLLRSLDSLECRNVGSWIQFVNSTVILYLKTRVASKNKIDIKPGCRELTNFGFGNRRSVRNNEIKNIWQFLPNLAPYRNMNIPSLQVMLMATGIDWMTAVDIQYSDIFEMTYTGSPRGKQKNIRQ
jgi:hypothetical protein